MKVKMKTITLTEEQLLNLYKILQYHKGILQQTASAFANDDSAWNAISNRVTDINILQGVLSQAQTE